MPKHHKCEKGHCSSCIWSKCKKCIYCRNKTSAYQKFSAQNKTSNKFTLKKLRSTSRLQSQLVNRAKKNIRNKLRRERKKSRKPTVGPLQHVFYVIVNTNLCMDKGTTSAMVGRSLIALHSKLDSDDVKHRYIDTWTKSGQNIVVLKGYDHKHLRYLHEEAKYSAIATHALSQNWDGTRMIVVLSLFGLVEDLDEILDGLSPLR